MNIPKYALDNKKVIFFILAILLIGGIDSFFKLPKKEDSPFVVKTAVLITQYPGATPEEVETLITEPIEREIQSMSEVDEIKSDSRFGISKINIDLDPVISPERMPAKWDELRRKVLNIQSKLPEGASAIMVNDDFGDVYGIYYALTMDEGFTYSELRDVAQNIKVEITPIKGVQKVSLFGEQTEVVNIFFDISTLANLGLDPNAIKSTLGTQNLLVNSGEVNAGAYQVKVNVDGTYKNLDDIRNQIIISKSGKEVKIGDIARVEKGYNEPPQNLMRVNGKVAIGIGVATGTKDDVVAVGKIVDGKLENYKSKLPIGMDLISLYPENVIADEANNGFIVNLIESLAIVIIIIFLAMGYRAGLLIGSSLLFSVGGTLLLMLLMDVGLNRTSLAAFIIAMGMLVDNAIVVTDNAQIGIMRGMSKRKALIEGATVPQWGLLGATFIAICSFLPMYLAPASVAEIVKPLFIVLAISLGLSWVLALTQTPLFGNYILKEGTSEESKDPYDTKLYHKIEGILHALIRKRYLTLTGVVAFLFFSLWVMSMMPQSFFPTMDKPYMRADLLFPEGYSIREVERKVCDIEKLLKEDERVKNFSFTLGGSPIRYYLASPSFGPYPHYSNVLVELHNSKETVAFEEDFYNLMSNSFPEIITRSSLFMLSPVPDSEIEIGFVGNNIDTLTALTTRAMEIAKANPMVMDVRNSWGTKIPVVNPVYSQEKGLRLGITRQQFAYSIKAATTGIPVGEYREKDLIMPILLKSSNIDSLSVNDIRTLPVYSSRAMQVSVDQVSSDYQPKYEYGVIRRINRERIMLMQCDPKRSENKMAAFSSVYEDIKNKMTIPEGYSLKYKGSQEQQDKSNKALAANIPLTFFIIYFVLLLLFPGAYKKPVVIMAMLPLIFIGVVWGLIVFGKSLDFFAMLGLLGLIGMNIKNAIVLVDQIDIEMNNGLTPLNAVVQATKTRIIPVSMASGTTILGMLPLLYDAMFAGMAATIMGGLLMATLLTIFVLPVAYCVFFKIR